MSKQFSPACERNRDPILAILRAVFADRHRVLEIGSGTGQHAVYFGAHLPQLIWQTSDLAQHHPSILAWQRDAALPNVLPPIEIDVRSAQWKQWPQGAYDAVFSANTLHIMSWQEVEAMFEGVGRLLPPGGVLAVYGPFRLEGRHTSDSNAQFDASLRRQAAHMGVRDQEAVVALAARHGLRLAAEHLMPANNRLLVWVREP